MSTRSFRRLPLRLAAIGKAPRLCLIGALRCYQFLMSPLLGQRCRFYPSCSEYAIKALQTHGVLRGLWLTIKRLCRCHPGCQGGVDDI